MSVIRTLDFKTIMTSQILYFDASIEEACRRFCEVNNITFLPFLEDQEKYAELHPSGAFSIKTIAPERIVQAEECIFHLTVLDKFSHREKDHEVLFVFDHGVLSGVVHICDYNAHKLHEVLYRLLLDFESSLRQYLFLQFDRDKRKGHEAILDFFRAEAGNTKNDSKTRNWYKSRYRAYEKREDKQRELETLGPFQTFYLRDILTFAAFSGESYFTNDAINCIGDLRNRVMHAADVVGHEILEDRSLIYEIEGLKRFFREIETFDFALRKLKNKLHFLEMEEGRKLPSKRIKYQV